MLNMSSETAFSHPPQRALMVREPYISSILTGKKRWELRGKTTNIRGRIGLIRSGSGMVIGECEIIGSEGPIEFDVLKGTENLPVEERNEIALDGRPPYVQKDGITSKTYAWVLARPLFYIEPFRYRHPSGAITFVDLTKPGVLACTEASLSNPGRQRPLF